MTMTKAEADAYGNVDFTTAKHDEGYIDKWYFYGCMFEITNHAHLVMPMTGGNGIWEYGFIGLGFIVVLTTGLMLNETSRKKNKRKRRTKI